jgi:hypothetical protein
VVFRCFRRPFETMAQWVEAATTIKVRGYPCGAVHGCLLGPLCREHKNYPNPSYRAQLTSLTCSKGTWVYPLCYGLLFLVYRQWHCWSSLRLAFGLPGTTTYFSAVGSLSWLPGFWRSLGDKGQQTIFASSIWWPGPNDEQRQVKPAAAKNEMRRRTICRRLKVKERNWKPIQKKARPRHFILLRGVFMTNNIIE